MENDKLENIDGKYYLNGLEMLSAGAARINTTNRVMHEVSPSREMISVLIFCSGHTIQEAVRLTDVLLDELERTKK